ncbi:MAG TPA: FdtA/QdtA family cupin domain-containing protein [Patescibacteria group bacterium]|uniref:Sugar 3,4-ketoisomerase QdtA cupin domain-containing protein n=1 Tax=Candidatus Woesebacteria bacterium RBG_13_46_13 TaxID=1802479 RepID=A0A1F7X5K3_9BACT|nr:MAG: hypothetical protein A2Y68_02940 [Candidatus Woesebacteria bacterium RBG_13_46_13]HJX59044.1 FdtA/QdtA family cupin domain-containing protein [Patescibacteria group bacterium]
MAEKNKDTHRYLVNMVNKIASPNFSMNPAELNKFIPENEEFIIKRVYWIDNPINEKKSGQHAHTDEDEIFIVIKGKASIAIDDDGEGVRKIELNENNIVWVPRYVWHGFDELSDDCIILALTSTNYDPERKGYIEDYKTFKESLPK